MLRALSPLMLLLVLAVAGAAGWIVHTVTHPPRRAYIVTPEKFGQLSERGIRASDETWLNRDGTTARGWLLRGIEGAPAVVLLHAYGANRSWLLNLGVKINETTDFTVLWPDLRGHGEDPPVEWTSFGGREADDTAAALDYLRTLKTSQGQPLVSGGFGIYGVEMGAYAALSAARDTNVRALVLDSVPAAPDEVLRGSVQERTGLRSGMLQLLAQSGARFYFLGQYTNTPACAIAAAVPPDQRVLLLAGATGGYLHDSTVTLAGCFPTGASLTVQSNLTVNGFNLASATGEQGETYDRRVIDFFDRMLRDGGSYDSSDR